MTFNALSFILISFVSMSLSQCKTSNTTKQSNISESIQQDGAYFQKWVAGVKGGGSGINLFIPIVQEGNSYEGVYFRGMYTTLEKTTKNNTHYWAGYFKTKLNTKPSLTMEDSNKKEFGNASVFQTNDKEPPVPIADNEAILTYTLNEELQYVIIKGIIEKPMEALPMQRNPNNR